MKIRTGFVSNSSSSSFILALPHKPTSVEEMGRWMFPDGVPEVISEYGYTITGAQAVSTAFRDLKEAEPITRGDMIGEFGSGTMYVDGFPRYPKWGMPYDQRKKAWDDYEKAMTAFAETLTEKFMAAHGDVSYFCISYSDNEGPLDTLMEHANVFSNLPSYRVSHH